MFGFTVYSSIDQAAAMGKIPLPGPGEKVVGRACGRRDWLRRRDDVTNPVSGTTTTGAFKIRNSWGTHWGDAGYGWCRTTTSRRAWPRTGGHSSKASGSTAPAFTSSS